jgi:hypothetical protein
MYCDRRLFRALTRRREGNFADARGLRRGDHHDHHRSLVELRCRLRMYSRTADIAYRTARPILMNRGPVPFRRDLANQECDTPRSLATCAGCSRGINLVCLCGGVHGPPPFVSSGWMHDAGEASAKRASSYAKFSSLRRREWRRSVNRLVAAREPKSQSSPNQPCFPPASAAAFSWI